MARMKDALIDVLQDQIDTCSNCGEQTTLLDLHIFDGVCQKCSDGNCCQDCGGFSIDVVCVLCGETRVEIIYQAELSDKYRE